jgi:hypothetical protein
LASAPCFAQCTYLYINEGDQDYWPVEVNGESLHISADSNCHWGVTIIKDAGPDWITINNYNWLGYYGNQQIAYSIQHNVDDYRYAEIYVYDMDGGASDFRFVTQQSGNPVSLSINPNPATVPAYNVEYNVTIGHIYVDFEYYEIVGGNEYGPYYVCDYTSPIWTDDNGEFNWNYLSVYNKGTYRFTAVKNYYGGQWNSIDYVFTIN